MTRRALSHSFLARADFNAAAAFRRMFEDAYVRLLNAVATGRGRRAEEAAAAAAQLSVIVQNFQAVVDDAVMCLGAGPEGSMQFFGLG